MKKYILGLMICMTTFIPSVKVMGTQVSLGKNNQPVNNSHKTEVVCKQKKSTTCSCKTCQMLEKQKQQKVDKKKHQTTCQCSTCKKQQKNVKSVQPKQTQKQVKQQTTSWCGTPSSSPEHQLERKNSQQPVRK